MRNQDALGGGKSRLETTGWTQEEPTETVGRAAVSQALLPSRRGALECDLDSVTWLQWPCGATRAWGLFLFLTLGRLILGEAC